MKNPVFIITGKQGGGKTTFLKTLIDNLHDMQFKTCGIIAEGFWNDNVREGFELTNILSGRRILFCERSFHEGWEKIRQFYVNPQGISFGENALQLKTLKTIDIAVIDEIGPFEIERKGWFTSVKNISDKLPGLPMIWVIRESLIGKIIDFFSIESYRTFNISEISAEEAATEIKQTISSIRSV